jgi:hypothetical protein
MASKAVLKPLVTFVGLVIQDFFHSHFPKVSRCNALNAA